MFFLNTILDAIFPIKCIICKKDGADLCVSCLSSSPPAERESAEWIFPLYDYRHPAIKKSLWVLKYGKKRRLAQNFALSMYETMIEEIAELSALKNFTEPLLIPIPLSPQRYRERGFNQSELLCEEIVKINSFRKAINLEPGKGILIKPKDTEHQARIKDRSIRLKNIVGSFSVREPSAVQGRNIILIDDILTTGATLSEARKVLRQAGAKKIIAFTIAH